MDTEHIDVDRRTHALAKRPATYMLRESSQSCGKIKDSNVRQPCVRGRREGSEKEQQRRVGGSRSGGGCGSAHLAEYLTMLKGRLAENRLGI